MRVRRASRHLRALALAVLSSAAPVGAPAAAAQSPVAAQLRARIEQLRATGSVEIAGDRVVHSDALAEAYERGGFTPLWTDSARRGELVETLRQLPADGLDAALYHWGAMERVARVGGPAAAADLDLLRTAALVEIARDLSVGRVRPALPGIEAPFAAVPRALTAGELLGMIGSVRMRDELAGLRPRHFVYSGLRAGLDRLRRIAAEGGWDPLPDGPTMRRDSADARIPALRRRLALQGYAAADSGVVTRFDEPLERAVRAFQHHHGLNEDGAVGDRTRAALDVPVEARIDQVRVNLERARWLGPELPARFVVVNTAGAKVYVVSGERVVFETRAIVGKQYTKTPVFSAIMRTVELDPTWTVPPGIVDEVLADVRRDSGYLERVGMRVLDRESREVDPRALDFTRFPGTSFPYTFRQEPGPTNPLGRIKLLLPNRYNVYLHDTPSRALFEREERTFSHGCIRVADPFGLAEIALDDPSAWSRAALEAATGRERPRVIPLRSPLPVLVFYWTASADERGELHFYGDAYGRDAAILEGLGRTVPRGAGGGVGPRTRIANRHRPGLLPTPKRRDLPTEGAATGM